MASSSLLQFVLNGQLIELQSYDPCMSLLHYLRTSQLLTGTKEGCAEGDCGACTVVLGVVQNERIQFQSVNACILFLPMLHGKAVFTVEMLNTCTAGKLHPVQQAMLENHASQCGFCTPGFVMSLFALFKNQTQSNSSQLESRQQIFKQASRTQINHALSGNLCRCTGYKPIIQAAQQMNAYSDETHWLTQAGQSLDAGSDETKLIEQLKTIKATDTLYIDYQGVQFYAPTTESALEILLSQHPKAIIIAGNTDVGLWVNKQLKTLPVMISVMQIATLQQIEQRDDALVIAAAVSLTDALKALTQYLPQLSTFFSRFASLPVRNAGTLVGNLANGSPIGDMPPLLLVLSAKLIIKSIHSTRQVPLSQFYLDYQQKDLAENEYVHSVLIPIPNQQTLIKSYKISKRKDQDISAVCAAFALCLDSQQQVSAIKIAFGGMAAIPKRATATETFLQGKPWNAQTLEQAMVILTNEFSPLSDLRATASYRQHITVNLLQRFYYETVTPAEHSAFSLDDMTVTA